MTQSLSSHTDTQAAEQMLATIRPHISSPQLQRITEKIETWEQASPVTTPLPSPEKKELPPLVMRTKGLPRALDPLYFTLNTSL